MVSVNAPPLSFVIVRNADALMCNKGTFAIKVPLRPLK